QAKLTYVIENQALLITTKEKAKGQMRPVVYSVADLVGAPESERAGAITEQDVQKEVAVLLQSLRRLQNHLVAAATNTQVAACCKEAGCGAAAAAAKTCPSSTAVNSQACPQCAKAAAVKPECCCAQVVK